MKDRELPRKIFHILFGISIILLLKYNLIYISHVAWLLIIGVILSFIQKNNNLPGITWLIKTFDRDYEKLPGKGAITYLFSIFLLLLFVSDRQIIYASIIILALGDSFSSIIGCRLKKTKYLLKTKHPICHEKLLEGTIWGIVFASLGAAVFVSLLEAVATSIVAMTIEGLEIRFHKDPVDDNLLIPISAAVTMLLIQLI